MSAEACCQILWMLGDNEETFDVDRVRWAQCDFCNIEMKQWRRKTDTPQHEQGERR